MTFGDVLFPLLMNLDPIIVLFIFGCQISKKSATLVEIVEYVSCSSVQVGEDGRTNDDRGTDTAQYQLVEPQSQTEII